MKKVELNQFLEKLDFLELCAFARHNHLLEQRLIAQDLIALKLSNDEKQKISHEYLIFFEKENSHKVFQKIILKKKYIKTEVLKFLFNQENMSHTEKVAIQKRIIRNESPRVLNFVCNSLTDKLAWEAWCLCKFSLVNSQLAKVCVNAQTNKIAEEAWLALLSNNPRNEKLLLEVASSGKTRNIRIKSLEYTRMIARVSRDFTNKNVYGFTEDRDWHLFCRQLGEFRKNIDDILGGFNDDPLLPNKLLYFFNVGYLERKDMLIALDYFFNHKFLTKDHLVLFLTNRCTDKESRGHSEHLWEPSDHKTRAFVQIADDLDLQQLISIINNTESEEFMSEIKKHPLSEKIFIEF